MSTTRSLASASLDLISVFGSSVSFAQLTNIDGTSLLVGGGGTLSLPALTSYTNTATFNGENRTLQASGPGSTA